jgi:hypothetical protein
MSCDNNGSSFVLIVGVLRQTKEASFIRRQNVLLIQGVSLAIGPKVFLITFKVIDVI